MLPNRRNGRCAERIPSNNQRVPTFVYKLSLALRSVKQKSRLENVSDKFSKLKPIIESVRGLMDIALMIGRMLAAFILDRFI